MKVAVGILVVRLRRSVLADRAGVPPATASSVSWLDVVLPLSLGVALARLLRLAAARPRDSAGPRSAVRRSARRDHRARRAAEDGALSDGQTHLQHAAGPTTTPRSITKTSDVNVRAILGFGAGLIVVGGRRPRRWSGCCSAIFDGREAAATRPQYPAGRASRQTRLPPEPRLQTNPREDLRELRAREDADAEQRTAGSTRTPASCGSRSTRR